MSLSQYCVASLFALPGVLKTMNLAKFSHLEEVAIPAYSVLIGHLHMRHGGRGYRGWHNLRYHTYLIPSSYDLKDAVEFAYKASSPVVKTSATSSGKLQRIRM